MEQERIKPSFFHDLQKTMNFNQARIKHFWPVSNTIALFIYLTIKKFPKLSSSMENIRQIKSN